jgi:hypothetical protein
MTLFKADRNFFIDLDTLKTARFEDTKDNEVIAHLLFKDGASETLEGDAARNLHRQLGGLDESAQKATHATPLEQEQFKAASAAPDLHLGKFHFSPSITTFASKKGWFYLKDRNGRRLILAFVNAKGSCSVRPFDADQNVALGKKYGPGDYQKHFADFVKGSAALTVDAQPNLERDCKERLPKDLFEYLRKQIEQIDAKNEAGKN